MSHKMGFYEKYIKRGQDFVLSSLALILLSPILGVTAILVRTRLGSPVIFTQDRPGRNGKVFKLYKFRTMTDARDAKGNLLSDEERLTDFGKKLRATSLDELPELMNIWKGDMSIVGPRPLLVQYLPRYNAHQARRHGVCAGAWSECDFLGGKVRLGCEVCGSCDVSGGLEDYFPDYRNSAEA